MSLHVASTLKMKRKLKKDCGCFLIEYGIYFKESES